jgi:hypothetical protein
METTDSTRSTVLLIAGVGKSGSTLLGAMLGQIPGYLNVGEVISLEHAWQSDHTCGCGAAITACRFWGPVIQDSIGSLDALDARQWADLHTKTLLAPATILRKLGPESADPVFPQLTAVYDSLLRRQPGHVIVDGSKSFRYARVLSRNPAISLRIVHLLRDPRAVEYSKARLLTDGHWKFSKGTTFRNTIQWLSLNLLLEGMGLAGRVPYYRLRYEDLVQSPAAVVSRLTAWATGDEKHIDIDSEGGVVFQENHTLGGSEVRMRTGRVVLSRRDDWVAGLAPSKRRLVTLLTWPLLLRYGYPIRTAPA